MIEEPPKQKKIDYDVLPAHTCPYNDWYRFKICGIITCKNYTPITPCHCLDIDRVKTTGTKFISDAELRMYKFPKKKITTRFVSLRRKKAIERAKYLIVLKQYIDFIKKKYEQQGECSPFVNGRYAQKAQTVYPLNVKILQFKNWMWHYLTDEDVHEEFLEQYSGECKTFKIEQLLATTTIKYNKILKDIKQSTQLTQV